MENDCLVLRKYTKCSIHDLENISKHRVSITSPKNFNDPLDSYYLDQNNGGIISILEKLIPKDQQKQIRMTCFSYHEAMLKERRQNCKMGLSNAEILMWTHYANVHQGICIEYAIPKKKLQSIDEFNSKDSDNIYLNEVDYLDGLAVNYEGLIKIRIEDKEPNRQLASIYFLKDKTFQYEHEYRLFCFSSDTKKYSTKEFDYIKKIIFGMRCSDDTRYLIECINKQEYKNGIELFKIDENFMEVSYGTR